MTVKLRVDDPVAASVEAIKEAARQAATSNQTSLANVGGGQVLVTFLRDYGGYKEGAMLYLPVTQAMLLFDNGVAIPAGDTES